MILARAIALTGGAELPGFREGGESGTGFVARVADDLVHAVIRGLRTVMRPAVE